MNNANDCNTERESNEGERKGKWRVASKVTNLHVT